MNILAFLFLLVELQCQEFDFKCVHGYLLAILGMCGFYFFLIRSIFRKSSCMYSAWAEQSDVVVPVSSWDMLSVSCVCVCARMSREVDVIHNLLHMNLKFASNLPACMFVEIATLAQAVVLCLRQLCQRKIIRIR